MEKEKQISTFNEELEKDYDFEIESCRIDQGSYGDISFGTMHKRNDTENKIPVALKRRAVYHSKEITDEHFKREKEFFKDIEKSGVNFDCIVKCYGTTHIDEKEYIVMEDLSKERFITIGKLLDDKYSFKEDTNRLKKIIKKLEKIKKELFESKTITHGDLHPGNIMTNLNNADIKLIDFGSSGVIKNESELTYNQNRYLNSDCINLTKLIEYMNKIILTQDLQLQ